MERTVAGQQNLFLTNKHKKENGHLLRKIDIKKIERFVKVQNENISSSQTAIISAKTCPAKDLLTLPPLQEDRKNCSEIRCVT